MTEGASEQTNTEAEHRTAIGRAYYAPYGHIRERLTDAHQKKNATQVFGKSGRHAALAQRLSTTKPFKVVAPAYNALVSGRINSDYIYGVTVSKKKATEAVQNAEWVLSKLQGFTTADYRRIHLPLR